MQKETQFSRHVNEVISNWSNVQYLRLHAGEMSAQEIRTVRAILAAVRVQLIEGAPLPRVRDEPFPDGEYDATGKWLGHIGDWKQH